MSAEGNAILAHVARLHYVRDLPKQEIARRLGVSRFKVARLIDQARAEGIVRFEISAPVEIDDDRSRALEDAFGLDVAVVVHEGSDAGAISRAAAAWVVDLARDGEPVGVAWGATLQAVAEALPAVPDVRASVVQICGSIPGLEPGTGPTELALRFAERLGGRFYGLPTPALPGRRARDALLANDAVRPTVEMFDRVALALVGIGEGHRFPGAPREAAGNLLVHVFDEQGRPLDTDVADRAIAMSRTQLERVRVAAVAGGHEKERAILGALRTGLLDTLITDAPSAAFALEAAR